jgi:hypothetical protein
MITDWENMDKTMVIKPIYRKIKSIPDDNNKQKSGECLLKLKVHKELK